MVTAARDRLARTLCGDTEAAFSAELTLRAENLGLVVEGFGPVRFPVTPAKARKLATLGQPARFGRGEQTVTDPDVRDTWEIPKHLVRAEWTGGALQVSPGGCSAPPGGLRLAWGCAACGPALSCRPARC